MSHPAGERMGRRIIMRELERGLSIAGECYSHESTAAHPERPRTRGECPEERPCPWVGCRYHLGLDVCESGAIQLTRDDCQPWELDDTCALDVAARGEHSLREVAATLCVTHQRVQQIELHALLRAARPERLGGLTWDDTGIAELAAARDSADEQLMEAYAPVGMDYTVILRLARVAHRRIRDAATAAGATLDARELGCAHAERAPSAPDDWSPRGGA